jgi:fluoride exporter
MHALCVFLGGGAGAVLRYAISTLFRSNAIGANFPWHTLAINVLGSLALGCLAATCRDKPLWFLAGVGLCGGFTTFSTFSLELVELLEAHRHFTALGYASISVLAAVIGAWLGLRCFP